MGAGVKGLTIGVVKATSWGGGGSHLGFKSWLRHHFLEILLWGTLAQFSFKKSMGASEARQGKQ
jgi:hypothetical protein